MAFTVECEKVGLRVASDERGLVHVVIDELGWRNCAQRGEDPFARRLVGPEDRVCMWCRELPGRERHAASVAVLQGR